METKHKKLTSKAGLTIPKDIRLAAGFAGGMAVDIEKTADGIMIRKHRPTCCYCGSVDIVRSFKGRYLQKLRRRYHRGGKDGLWICLKR